MTLRDNGLPVNTYVCRADSDVITRIWNLRPATTRAIETEYLQGCGSPTYGLPSKTLFLLFPGVMSLDATNVLNAYRPLPKRRSAPPDHDETADFAKGQ